VQSTLFSSSLLPQKTILAQLMPGPNPDISTMPADLSAPLPHNIRLPCPSTAARDNSPAVGLRAESADRRERARHSSLLRYPNNYSAGKYHWEAVEVEGAGLWVVSQGSILYQSPSIGSGDKSSEVGPLVVEGAFWAETQGYSPCRYPSIGLVCTNQRVAEVEA